MGEVGEVSHGVQRIGSLLCEVTDCSPSRPRSSRCKEIDEVEELTHVPFSSPLTRVNKNGIRLLYELLPPPVVRSWRQLQVEPGNV